MERGDLCISVSTTVRSKAKHATEKNVSKNHRSLVVRQIPGPDGRVESKYPGCLISPRVQIDHQLCLLELQDFNGTQHPSPPSDKPLQSQEDGQQ